MLLYYLYTSSKCDDLGSMNITILYDKPKWTIGVLCLGYILNHKKIVFSEIWVFQINDARAACKLVQY